MQHTRHSRFTRRLAAALFVSIFISCQADREPTEASLLSEAVIGGHTSSAAQNAVLLLEVGEAALCTGTLVAPNLVLTARHCVAETDPDIACAPDGSAQQGGAIQRDVEPESILVYAGLRQNALAPRALGARLVHEAVSNLCNHDIAFVVLDRALDDLPVASLRTRDNTTSGELVTSVGWGITKRGELPKVRLQRPNVRILDVGPSSETPSNEFVVGESICSGDSGGPALSERGAVVGVVSSGGNGMFDPLHPELGCVGPQTRNTYTRLAPFERLIEQAFAAAGATPTVEE
jgi:hypothetical protein